MVNRELIYRGSSKDVYRVAANRVEISFVDQLAVFGRRLNISLDGKGALMCDAAVNGLRRADAAGVPNHFVERVSDRAILVEAGYPSHQAERDGGPTGAFTIECVTRHRVAGSLFDRLKSHADVAHRPHLPYGASLDAPLVEFCARNATVADYRSRADLASDPQRHPVEEMARLSLLADTAIAPRLAEHAFVQIDGKKEFAYSADGDIILVDCFATVEEDRIWRIEPDGSRTELTLDPLRQHFRQSAPARPPDLLLANLLESYRAIADALR